MTHPADIFRRVLPDLPDRFRSRRVGTVPDVGAVLRARCECHDVRPVVAVDPWDPFAGRTPSVAELERLFADGGRTKRARVGRPVSTPVSLAWCQYVFDGRLAAAYVGQCPDCGVVLWAEVSPC